MQDLVTCDTVYFNISRSGHLEWRVGRCSLGVTSPTLASAQQHCFSSSVMERDSTNQWILLAQMRC